MIKRTKTADGVKCTFTLTSDLSVSVVGDFNSWDPLATPLKVRSNGTRSAAVTLPYESQSAFRYLEDGGRFFDDPDADVLEDNGVGATHGVVIIGEAPAPKAAPAKKPAATKS